MPRTARTGPWGLAKDFVRPVSSIPPDRATGEIDGAEVAEDMLEDTTLMPTKFSR